MQKTDIVIGKCFLYIIFQQICVMHINVGKSRGGSISMKRLLISGILYSICMIMSFAGDVAVFKDIGFSKDGKTYVFAEFGITDRTFQGYGEIYTVDVERNAYVPNGVFITKPSPATAGKNGRNIYDELIFDHSLKMNEIIEIVCTGLIKHHSNKEIEDVRNLFKNDMTLFFRNRESIFLAFLNPLLPAEVYEDKGKNSKKS